MANKRRLVQGILFFVLMLFYAVVHAYFAFLHVGSYDGWFGEGSLRIRITRTDPKGPATALQADDEILAINGITFKQDPDIFGFADGVPPGTRYKMAIRRGGQELEIPLTTAEFPPDKSKSKFGEQAAVIVKFIFLLIGLAVFLLKPDNPQVWLLALMLGAFTGLNTWPMPVMILGRWVELAVAVAKILSLWFLPLFVRLFLNFPERLPILRRFPKLEVILYWPFYVFILPSLIGGRLPGFLRQRYFDLTPIAWLGRHSFFNVAMLVIVLYIVAGLVCLFANYRTTSQDARRRLRVVMFGSGIGFIALLLAVLSEYLGLGGKLPGLNDWLEVMMLIAMPFVPFSFAYAIVRHKVIPVSLIIRRGVRYLLVSRGSVLIEAAVVILTVTAILTYIFSQFNPPGIVIGTVSAAVAIVVWKLETRLHEKYLAPIIDRKFFRESYSSHQIIADLTDSLRSTTSLPQLCEQVATKIQTALQTESVIVLLRDDATGDYLSGYSCEYHAEDGKSVACRQQFRLPHFAEVIAKLKESGQPIEIESSSNGEIPPSHSVEAEALSRMKSSLLLPLLTNVGMPGVISLGPRLGDLPFSREDKHLLMSVAGPTTFAIENARLVERMIEDARRRQELEVENEQRAKELEEARQLQFSMLPKKVPQLPHLEIAAYMKTATEVGGDYYDFHLSDSGELTVVVGDATGHGLKAGTVVTATKSLFNHLAATPDITDIFRHSSRALKLMNMRALYMAMAMVKVREYRMTVSSAGMPPVLIYRAANGEVEEIAIQGIPLGSLSGYVYREEEVRLFPGDVIVLMSDGFPERFNDAGEMLGYEQSNRILLESATRSAQQIIEGFVRVGETWAAGRPTDDDVTFVVLKVL